MEIFKTADHTPFLDGFFMPAEFSPHRGCIIIWPERPGSWPNGAWPARKAFVSVIKAIAASEKVYVAAGKKGISSAIAALFGSYCAEETERGSFVCKQTDVTGSDGVEQQAAAVFPQWRQNVEIFPAETDDAWARDIAPTFLKGKDLAEVRAVNWEFNAWGGKVDGLYASWQRDNAFASYFAKRYGFPMYNAAPFVLEGGSIHSDGEGTLLVTTACLLSSGRNPSLDRTQIEEKLRQYLGIAKVLWLPRGIYMDETNEHVDNICAFIRPAEVVLAWTDNPNDPQYALSREDFDYLSNVRDARGRKLTIHKLPIPDVPICVEEEEISGYAFEDGEDAREPGERLAASYVNFYYSNQAVILPAFGGANQESDRRAADLMRQLNPGRRVVPIYARDILAGGGNIHCITQQIPL